MKMTYGIYIAETSTCVASPVEVTEGFFLTHLLPLLPTEGVELVESVEVSGDLYINHVGESGRFLFQYSHPNPSDEFFATILKHFNH